MCMGTCCRSMDPAAGAPLHPAGETPSLSTAGLGQENRQPLLQKGQPLLTGPMQQIREQTPLCPSLSKPRTETPRRKHREVSHVSWGLTEKASQSQAATQPEPALSRPRRGGEDTTRALQQEGMDPRAGPVEDASPGTQVLACWAEWAWLEGRERHAAPGGTHIKGNNRGDLCGSVPGRSQPRPAQLGSLQAEAPSHRCLPVSHMKLRPSTPAAALWLQPLVGGSPASGHRRADCPGASGGDREPINGASGERGRCSKANMAHAAERRFPWGLTAARRDPGAVPTIRTQPQQPLEQPSP